MSTSLPVWATRPRAQNSAWCSLLSQSGFTPINAPVLAISPVTDLESCQAVKNHILDLDQFDMLIFVSQNAVAYGWEWIDNYWPQMPGGQTLLAVGRKTAITLAQCLGEGQAILAPAAMNSEALLAMPECQNVADKQVLIFRGKGGLPVLGATLEDRGAKVSYCELYHRQGAELQQAQVDALKAHIERGPLVVPVFSGESLQNLADLIRSENGLNFSDCSHPNLYLVVPGERVANMANELWFKQVITAENAGQDTMLSTILASLE